MSDCNSVIPLDMVEVREIMDGNTEIFRELIDLFLDTFASRLRGIGRALKDRDSRKARFLAHQFKGTLRNFAAYKAVDAASRVEGGTGVELKEETDAAFTELNRCVAELAQYFSSGAWEYDFNHSG